MVKKENPTDKYLIEQFKAGNKTVLPILVKRYHIIFCEKAYWVTKNRESAKDIAQESWLIIIEKIHSLKNIDSFKSWAFRIVYTKAISNIKKSNKEKQNQKSNLAILEKETSNNDYKNTILKKMSNAITQLPKEKQDIIRLFYREEYSINEISVFLNIPLGTVKSRLFKAREKLKSIIKTQDYEK